jgi:hypothetical protein
MERIAASSRKLLADQSIPHQANSAPPKNLLMSATGAELGIP